MSEYIQLYMCTAVQAVIPKINLFLWAPRETYTVYMDVYYTPIFLKIAVKKWSRS